jgi:hypothetical protein
VAKKHIDQPCLHLAGANQFRHLIGDFVGAFAFGPDDEFGAINGEHKGFEEQPLFSLFERIVRISPNENGYRPLTFQQHTAFYAENDSGSAGFLWIENAKLLEGIGVEVI